MFKRTPHRYQVPGDLVPLPFLSFFIMAGIFCFGEKGMAEERFDFVIKNAVVFDGISRTPVRTDVGIVQDRIAVTGSIDAEAGAEVIDARGLYLVPGFIDAHTHSDFNPLVYPELPNKLLQGVTTEITGNCGMSAAPAAGRHREEISGVWAREGVVIPENLPWESVAAYRRVLEEKGLMTNHAILIGHGNLRAAVMGFENRPASAGEIRRMKAMLHEAMKEDAAGVSFGLVYLPGIFASEQEAAAVCGVVREYSGVCAFHMRSEGSHLVESVQEVIRIGERTGAKLQISHLKAAGTGNWGKIRQVFSLIEDAAGRGIQIRADAYPYHAGFAELGVVLPDHLYKREDRIRLFRDPAQREDLLGELRRHYGGQRRDWRSVMVAAISGDADKSYQGRTIAEISAQQGRDPVEVLVELLADSEFEVSAFYFSQHPEVVEEVLEKPYVFIGSDSIADGSGYPHPRAYGTFPKIIRELLDRGDEAAFARWVKKATAEAADHFNLERRGRIAPGYFADLVLFDPAMVSSQASYQNPSGPSRGIEWVFVNGRPAVRNGKYQGIKAGTFV